MDTDGAWASDSGHGKLMMKPSSRWQMWQSQDVYWKAQTLQSSPRKRFLRHAKMSNIIDRSWNIQFEKIWVGPCLPPIIPLRPCDISCSPGTTLDSGALKDGIGKAQEAWESDRLVSLGWWKTGTGGSLASKNDHFLGKWDVEVITMGIGGVPYFPTYILD